MTFKTLVMSLAVVLAAATAAAQEIDPRDFEVRASEIRGVVRIRGCVPDGSALALTAVPLSVGTTDGRAASLDPRGVQVRADIEPTTDLHVFRFQIRGLNPFELYQLSMFVPPSPICPRIFWRHARRGLAVSGGEPVLIDGLVATTSLEVLAPSTDEWVGADPLDIGDPSTSLRRFRWRSIVPGVVDGELQLSTSPFPSHGDAGACDEPAGGVFYRDIVDAGDGGWYDVAPINIAEIVARRAGVPGGITRSAHRLLHIGAPIFARVLPRTSGGAACDAGAHGIPGWVIFAKVPATPFTEPVPSPEPQVLEPSGTHTYRPPYFHRPSTYEPHEIRPTYSQSGYRVVKPHTLPTWKECQPSYTVELTKAKVPNSQIPAFADPLGCTLVRSSEALWAGKHLAIGFRFQIERTYSSSGGGSVLEITGSLITGAVQALGVGVEFFGGLYNEAIAAAKQLTYEFLLTTPGLGQLCDSHPDECKKGIEIGVQTGLIAMGLPPSAPSWDQLEEEGIDYLAGVIGDELEAETGGVLPSDVTQLVLKELATRVVIELSNDRGGEDPASDWAVDDDGFAPASWTVTIVKHSGPPLPIDVALFSHKSHLFEGKKVPLPSRFPAPLLPGLTPSFLRIPIVLPPNIDGVPAPLCRSTYPAYSHPHPAQICVGLLAPGAKPICEYQRNNGPESPWIRDEDCALMAPLVRKYYRNAYAAKVAATPCAALTAITLAHGPASTAYIPWPGFTFIVAAAVPPMVGGEWQGPFIHACPGG